MSPTLSEKVREQAEIMRRQVTFYLDRARAAARARTFGRRRRSGRWSRGSFAPMRSCMTTGRLTFDVDLQPGLKFRGEAQDLTDLIGNLLDNAGKWARERVSIRAARAVGGDQDPGPLSRRRDRRRRPGPRQKRARRGDRARQAARRVAARLRPRPVDRRRSRLDLWRLAATRRKPARGLAGDPEAAVRMSARRQAIPRPGEAQTALRERWITMQRTLLVMHCAGAARPCRLFERRLGRRAAGRRGSPRNRPLRRFRPARRSAACSAGRSALAQRRRPPGGMGGAGRRARFGSAALLARLAWRVRFCRARRRDRRRLPRLFPDHLYRRPAEPRPWRRLQAAGRKLENDELRF